MNVTGMDYLDRESITTELHGDRLKGKPSDWRHVPPPRLESDGRKFPSTYSKRPSKKLQGDGRRWKRKSDEYGYIAGEDMSHRPAREATFKNFAAKVLIEKLVDCGYYYTGEEDKTVCHKCGAAVCDWKEKDHPAVFHEPHCIYHATEDIGASEECKHEEASGALEERSTSLLDAPITEANEVLPPPVLLTPTPVALEDLPEPSKSSPEELHANISAQEPPFESNSMLLTQEIPDFSMAHASSTYNQSLFPSGVPVANVFTNEHQQLLERLNLWSEEDRRKTFFSGDKWEQNTNNVVHPHDLASDGFFYLGNLDRTQCCCCNKVFKCWVRGDIVNVVHRQTVPYCKLARGAVTQNIPIPLWPAAGPSPAISESYEASLSSHFSAEPVAHHPAQVTPPSHQAQDVQIMQSSEPYYTRPGITFPSTESSPVHETSPPRFPLDEPLNLSQRRQTPSLEPSTSQKEQNAGTLQGYPFVPKVVLPPAAEQHHLQPASMESSSSLPLDERPIEASQETRPAELVLPQGEVIHSLPSPGRIPQSGEQEVAPKDPYRGVQPQSASSSPEESPLLESLQPPTVEPRASSLPLPTVRISSHVGQTSLYDPTRSLPSNAREQSLTPMSVLLTPSASNVPTIPCARETNWSALFPCNEPSQPNFRTAIAREETYNYLWPCSRLQAAISEFAKAGFYYMGNGDHVKCWYCNGGVRNWKATDDPWEEHARLYPTCEYVLQQRGPEFVSEVSSRNRVNQGQVAQFPGARSHRSSSSSSPGFGTPGSSPGFESPIPGSPAFAFGSNTTVNRFGSSPPRVIDPRQEEARRREMLERALNSDTVLAVVEMGFELSVIKKVIKRKLRSGGSAFSNPEALMDAVLAFDVANASNSSGSDMEQDPVPQDRPSTSSGPRSSGSATGGLDPGQASGRSVPLPERSDLRGAESLDPKELDVRLREYQQEKRCKVCLDRDANVVFVPCGHLCTCVECAGELRTCPLCRKRIQKSIKTYTS